MSAPKVGDRVKLEGGAQGTITARALVNGKPSTITITPDPNERGELAKNVVVKPFECTVVPETPETKAKARLAIDALKANNQRKG